jgi:NAD(P)-dependent dehydrogenase (short-subunit alcohol dehydrogenase family)
MNADELREFAKLYTAAWCSQSPARVAAFFSESGSLKINEAAPAVGREAITAAAQGFMTAFPDMIVSMDAAILERGAAVYRWTLTGRNTGPGGTGNAVRISGHEEWRFGPDGLIAESKGHFDEAEYQRQLKVGASLPLAEKVALVAGGTRGAGRGIAVELGAAGATVYVTGRTTRTHRSEYGRPETIEETAELVSAAGGQGIAVQADHLVAEEVRTLVNRIRAKHRRLDILVNDLWGGEDLKEWNKAVWEHDLANGLRLLSLGVHTHLITAHFALPLLIERPGGLLVEVTDGTAEYNADHYRINPFYDLAKVAVTRMAWAHAQDLARHGATSVCITPGWLRSEMMLDAFGVTEATWRDAAARVPHFVISETPRFVGRAVAALAADPDRSRWNGHSLSSGQLAKIYGFTDVDGSQPDAWRYVVEVQEAGRPADPTGYR